MRNVSVEYRNNLSIVTIESPPVNALSQSVRSGLVTELEAIKINNDVEAIVLQQSHHSLGLFLAHY